MRQITKFTKCASSSSYYGMGSNFILENSDFPVCEMVCVWNRDGYKNMVIKIMYVTCANVPAQLFRGAII